MHLTWLMSFLASSSESGLWVSSFFVAPPAQETPLSPLSPSLCCPSLAFCGFACFRVHGPSSSPLFSSTHTYTHRHRTSQALGLRLAPTSRTNQQQKQQTLPSSFLASLLLQCERIQNNVWVRLFLCLCLFIIPCSSRSMLHCSSSTTTKHRQTRCPACTRCPCPHLSLRFPRMFLCYM